MSKPMSFLAAALLLVSAGVHALPSDSEQPIHIQADAAEMNDNTGISIYTGNVVIDQGTLHIKADEVRIRMDANDEVEEIIARNYGTDSLAHFEQQPDADDDKVLADAIIITYFVKEKKLNLSGSASLRQSRNYTEGEILKYDVDLGKMNVEAGADRRVEMIFYPREN